ncbi:MAG: cyclopropane fatty-acyl-phospholipid synthase-like methyltransferase [Porticoccus sp.]|jgi:cyclopropane fatty-acyl-phospholipid synthase-like methyltransferase
MMIQKPFSQACENNQKPILEVLLRVFADRNQLLEIGSGTGQHAVYCAPRLPHLIWQTADLEANHLGINAWLDDCPAENLRRPILLNANHSSWSVDNVDAVFTANTCHIMAWESVVNLFAGLDTILVPGAMVAIYGPFNYSGQFTSDSNARFDLRLKQQVLHQGIRDFEAVNCIAEKIGLELAEDNSMPANNRLLVWKKM